MAAPVSTQPPQGTKRQVRLHPDDEATTLRALREARENPQALLTLGPGDLERWAETGEWPESRS